MTNWMTYSIYIYNEMPLSDNVMLFEYCSNIKTRIQGLTLKVQKLPKNKQANDISIYSKNAIAISRLPTYSMYQIEKSNNAEKQ